VKEWLAIGRVRTAFGTAGEVKAESYSGSTEHFRTLTTLLLERGAWKQEFTVQSVRVVTGAVLIKLAGVDSPEAAATLRGSDIIVERAHAAPLEEGEYYYADLEGLRVLHDGALVGRVTAIWESGSIPLLEISRESGGRVMLPFSEGFFGEVDLEAETLELRDQAVLNPEDAE
jgi:16S rRNA processing protein RimM